MRPVIYTIGHSTRPLEAFVPLLWAHGVARLIDVRTIPRSRHNPQYNRDQLPRVLARAGLGYEHAPALGGLRHARPDSPNGGWRNASFRGYADYMLTAEFRAALGDLIAQAKAGPVAVMCAEAVPWRCHRSLIADALIARGVRAEEIVSETSTRAHRLTPFARVRGTRITYPPEPAG